MRIKFFNGFRFNASHLRRFPIPCIWVCKYGGVWQAVIVIDRGPVRCKWRERDRPFKDQRLAGWGWRQGGHAFDGLTGHLLGYAGCGPHRFNLGQCSIGCDFHPEPDLARIFSFYRRPHHAANLPAPRVAVTLAVFQRIFSSKRPLFGRWRRRCWLGRQLMMRDGCRRMFLACLSCNNSSGGNGWCLRTMRWQRKVFPWRPWDNVKNEGLLFDLR